MTKRKKAVQKRKKALDTLSQKRGRGRPRSVRPSEVFGRAENYRATLRLVWSKLRGPLLATQKIEDVTKAFEEYAQSCVQEFVPRLASDILKVIHERKFPKRPMTQLDFLADSLAGRPNVEPRTSRDICAKERAKECAQSPHRIIRKEFYIECSCGYKGPARNDACRKCGAVIPQLPEMLWGLRSS